MKFIFIIHFVILYLNFYLYSLEVYEPKYADPILEDWRWKKETLIDAQGMNCMDFGPNKTLWFGGVGRIGHYHEKELRIYEFPPNLISKISNHKKIPQVKAISVLSDGRPVMLVEDSLVVKNDKEWEVILKTSESFGINSKIFQDKNSYIWLLKSNGLWKITPDLKSNCLVYQPGSKGYLGSMSLDKKDGLWLAEMLKPGRARLIHFDLKTNELKPSLNKRYDLPFKTTGMEMHLCVDDDGKVWYGDTDQDTPLGLFDPFEKKWLQNSVSEVMMKTFSLSKSKNGEIWAGGRYQLLRYSKEKGINLYTHRQLNLPEVPLTVYQGDGEKLWILGYGGYVNSIDLRNQYYTTINHLHFQCETKEGILWFSTLKKDGVVEYHPDRKLWRRHEMKDGVIDEVYNIIITKNNKLLAIGRHNGRAAFSVYDGANWKKTELAKYGRWIESRAILEAEDGSIWMGIGGRSYDKFNHGGGLLQFIWNEDEELELVKHHSPPTFPNFISVLTQSDIKNFRIGSNRLHEYDVEAQKVHSGDQLPGIDTIDQIYDRNNNLWVAREHGGVFRFQQGSWKQYRSEDGLSGTNFSELHLLSDGSLLVASETGISRYDGSRWFSDVFPSSWSFQNRWSSIREQSDGSIWFNFKISGKVEDLDQKNGPRYYSIRYRPNRFAPDTQITQWQKEVSPFGNTHINWSLVHNKNSIKEHQLLYSYRINNGPWSSFTEDTGVTLMNLSSGAYLFEVRSRDSDFNVDPSPAKIEFSVLPPIWKQAWFILTVSGFLCVIVYLIRKIVMIRERHLMDQQQQKEQFLIKEKEDQEKYHREVSQLKASFVTNVSHELRTPITVISGRVQMLLENEKDSSRKSYLNIVQNNVQRLSNLIGQLLDLKKLEESQLQLHEKTLNVATVINEWVRSLASLAEEKQIKFRYQGLKKCYGRFDEDKFQKVITNLVSNAIKYTPEGGQIEVKLEASETELRFNVIDSGIGISAEYLPHIFDRFYRVSESSMVHGAGIGLHLTKELVDLMGGEIKVKSSTQAETGKSGSRFEVILPIKGSELQKTIPVVVKKENSELKRLDQRPLVMVIEDDLEIQQLLVDGLSESYQVMTETNGKSGLQTAVKLIPDLIISDVMMPFMDGISLCHELKQKTETSHIPVIMLTAKASNESQKKGLHTGADDYIIKPFNLELLLIRVSNLLESRKRLRERYKKEFLADKTIPAANNEIEKEFMDKIMEVLENQSTNCHFKTSDLAAALFMSTRSLSRKLKAVTDQSPKEFINTFKMKKASRLLLNTDMTIQQIAFEMGVDEASNFSRMFKHCYDVSPTEYREKHKLLLS